MITELQNCGETLLMEATGLGIEIATQIEHEIQSGACDDFSLAAESDPHPGESDCGFHSPIGMHIGHIESTPQNIAELRNT